MRLVYEVIWNDGKFWATFEISKERKNASELKNGRQQIKIEGTLFDNCLVFWRDDWKMRSQQNETYQCFSLRCVSILYAPTRWLANCIVVCYLRCVFSFPHYLCPIQWLQIHNNCNIWCDFFPICQPNRMPKFSNHAHPIRALKYSHSHPHFRIV